VVAGRYEDCIDEDMVTSHCKRDEHNNILEMVNRARSI